MTTELKKERDKLAETERDMYDPDNFPGSLEYNEHSIALKALTVFDAAHPAIIAEIKAQRQRKDAEIAKEVGWI